MQALAKSDHVPNNVNVLYVVSFICGYLHDSMYVKINVRDYLAEVVAEPERWACLCRVTRT